MSSSPLIRNRTQAVAKRRKIEIAAKPDTDRIGLFIADRSALRGVAVAALNPPFTIGSRDTERPIKPALSHDDMIEEMQRPRRGPSNIGATPMMEQIAKIDMALDELLVGLGGMVLRLSHPQVTRTHEERTALARSVNQFSTCAARSHDPRVRQLDEDLRATLKPRLRLVASR